MADPAKFGHDRLGHLLADRLLKVPKFQRAYAWDSSNVEEFLDDLAKARSAETEHFMGTVVLAEDTEDSGRQLVVDGQQRLTTTALLLIAARDRLREVEQAEAAKSIDDRYLKRYELSREETVTRLVLSPNDLPAYDALVEERYDASRTDALTAAYSQCREYVNDLSPDAEDYRALIDLVGQLADKVQILLAVASGIPEAYVIFETLNDRGADLTTADLMKNYLFSQSGDSAIGYVEATWTAIATAFEKPEDLVKFIRYEYSSRRGKVTNRKLYRALQEDIGIGAANVKKYLQRLEAALGVFLALRDPDHQRWGALSYDVRDSLLAFRRFGFESSMPLLLAVFREWGDAKAGKVIRLVAGWSVRAMMGGKLGGGSAEGVFCEAATAVADGSATNQPALRKAMGDFIPGDADFKQSFIAYGALTTTKAKYLLGMLEKQYAIAHGVSAGGVPDWSPKSVTVEHIIADSSGEADFGTHDDYEEFLTLCDQIGNLTLLERNLNKDAANSPFGEKKQHYLKSSFPMTAALGSRADWTVADSRRRATELADLAVAAWPR